MTLDELRAVRARSLLTPGLEEFVDSLLTYLHEREGGPFEPKTIDTATGGPLESHSSEPASDKPQAA